jgi:hypothetical protein
MMIGACVFVPQALELYGTGGGIKRLLVPPGQCRCGSNGRIAMLALTAALGKDSAASHTLRIGLVLSFYDIFIEECHAGPPAESPGLA